MADINSKKLLNIMSSKPEARYLYFIRKTVDFEKVWGLYKDGWALVANDESQQAIPFWPEESFAKVCATDSWIDYIPRAINLLDFINNWLPGMNKDGMLVAIFPNTQNRGVLLMPEKLIYDIHEEEKKY